MDYDYMGQLVLSVLIFAPGVVLLATCAFIGVLVMLEKSGLFGLIARDEAERFELEEVSERGANPAEGEVVSRLTRAIADESAARDLDDEERKVGTTDR